jgi:hypothetical protein
MGLLAPDDRVVDMITRARAEADALDAMFSGCAIAGRFRMYADTMEELLADRDMHRDRCARVVKTNDELARVIEAMKAKRRRIA